MNPPFATGILQTLYNTPAFTLPGTNLTQGLSGLESADPFKDATLRVWDPGVRPAEVQQWNFSTEFQFPGQNVLTTGYVGQHGTHLMVAMPYLQKILVPASGGSPAVVLPGPYLSGNPALKAEDRPDLGHLFERQSEIQRATGDAEEALRRWARIPGCLHLLARVV